MHRAYGTPEFLLGPRSAVGTSHHCQAAALAQRPQHFVSTKELHTKIFPRTLDEENNGVL